MLLTVSFQNKVMDAKYLIYYAKNIIDVTIWVFSYMSIYELSNFNQVISLKFEVLRTL